MHALHRWLLTSASTQFIFAMTIASLFWLLLGWVLCLSHKLPDATYLRTRAETRATGYLFSTVTLLLVFFQILVRGF